MPKFSFVIPCYGSENTIGPVLNEIEEVMAQRPEIDYDVICVNDKSPDNVLGVLRELAKTNHHLTVVDLSQNMGKHSALMAGYAMVTGDIGVGLDDDGQCPVYRLWDLYDALGDDYDLVMAKYPEEKQSAFKKFGSSVNALMSRFLLGKPKGYVFSNFAVCRRYVLDEIVRYKNPYPNVEGLVLRVTKRITTVEMEERERIAGKGNFNFSRSFKLFLNGVTSFSVIPLRISTVVGLITAFIGFIFGIYVVVKRIINPDVVMGYSSLMAVLLFLSGMIMFMLGIVGEYIGRIFICINNSPQYVIREIIHYDKAEESDSPQTTADK